MEEQVGLRDVGIPSSSYITEPNTNFYLLVSIFLSLFHIKIRKNNDRFTFRWQSFRKKNYLRKRVLDRRNKIGSHVEGLVFEPYTSGGVISPTLLPSQKAVKPKGAASAANPASPCSCWCHGMASAKLPLLSHFCLPVK